MHQFKTPNKNKCFRKRQNFDVDALEAEAIAAGLGDADLVRRSDHMRRQAARDEDEGFVEAEKRRSSSAYRAAKAKADEACRALMMDQVLAADGDRRGTARTKRNLEAIAAPKIDNEADDGLGFRHGFVITETEQFAQGIRIDKDFKPVVEKDEATEAFEEDSEKQAVPENVETIREAPIGKGMAGALKLLKERGALKETEDGGGQKEGFRLLCHRFHGKGPGKTKQEKRRRLDELELKSKRVNCSDAPSETAERMREAQARLKTPYLVLSGRPKPGI